MVASKDGQVSKNNIHYFDINYIKNGLHSRKKKATEVTEFLEEEERLFWEEEELTTKNTKYTKKKKSHIRKKPTETTEENEGLLKEEDLTTKYTKKKNATEALNEEERFLGKENNHEIDGKCRLNFDLRITHPDVIFRYN